MPSSIYYWQFPGEVVNKITGVDNYSVVSNWQYGTTPGFNYTFRAKAKCSGSSPPEGVAPSIPRSFVAGQEITVFTTGTWSGSILGFEKFVNGSNVNGKISYTERTGGNSNAANCAPRTIEVILSTLSPQSTGTVRLKTVPGSYNEPYVTGDIYDVEFIPTTTPPKSCINGIVNTCTLTFYKNGVEVLKKTKAVCPEVWAGQECPEGTCPVDCGAYTCCYNDQGISVESFLR
ncbi:MAG: hypothetical protein ACRC2S_10570 [Waterburya sp.]